MGLKVKWSKPALDELDEALEYIAFDNPDAARTLGKKAKEATRKLRDYPMKGRIVPDYEDPTIRELIIAPFRIIYTTEDPDVVYILAAVRSERLLDPGIPDRA